MKKNLFRALCVCMAIMLCAANGMAAENAPTLKDDFYAAVNAEWLATAEIQPDKPTTGGFQDLSDGIEKALMTDFDAMLRGDKEPGNDEMENFIAFYRLATDFEARDAAGVQPLLPYMEMVEGLTSLEDFSKEWAQWSLQGLGAPFSISVMPDMGNASIYALYFEATSLFLMDKSYYEDDATKGQMQAPLQEMAVKLLVMTGKTEEEATTIVQQALAFDESLAPYTRSSEEASDYTKMYNPTDFADFDEQITGFDFSADMQALLGAVPETVIVTEPDYFAAFNQLVNEDTFENMKSWMLVQTVAGFAPLLSDEFRVEATSFSRALSGVSKPTSKEKAAYYLASNVFDEVTGIYYGKTYFGEDARQDATDMVGALIDVYESRLASNTWLSDETRTLAIEKLKNMTINVGYPDEARPVYGKLKTVTEEDGGTLFDNCIAFNQILLEDNLSKWNTAVERGLWQLSADTVNAMYSPLDNSINFPAAILQAPFYSLEQSASANYGGIGAVIAHETSHAFDPNGAKFDAHGNLADWWTKEDYAKFEELSQAMVDEFDGIAYAGGTVNGKLTVGENVADAGGLSCALEAAKKDDDVDLEAFFTNWAVVWRQKASPEYETMMLTLDVHAPSKLRANIQLENLDDFFSTFDIQEGDGMYRAPEDRVSIW